MLNINAEYSSLGESTLSRVFLGLILFSICIFIAQMMAIQAENRGISGLLLDPISASEATGSGPGEDNIRVIIGFREKPDVGLFKSHGGKANHTFSIIPAIAGTIPHQKLSSLRGKSKVAYIELDRKVKALGESLSWGIDRIDADKVWDRNDDSAYDGSGVKIAIFDTGIDWNHPDLKGNCGDENLGENRYGYDFVNDDNNPMDGNGHGTSCAGIASAVNNEKGVIGVNPDASLYGVKVLADNGSGLLSYIVEGIEWSVNNGMDIASMSLGSDNSSPSLRNACRNAYDEGLLLVAAAGNAGENSVDYPAKLDSVIAVGATDTDDSLASFSNFGPEIELTAPGVGIETTDWDDTYTTYFGGTSASCPHVSGAAALVWAENPSFTNEQVRERLDNTAEDLGPAGRDEKYGYGLVDALAATGGNV